MANTERANKNLDLDERLLGDQLIKAFKSLEKLELGKSRSKKLRNVSSRVFNSQNDSQDEIFRPQPKFNMSEVKSVESM